MIKMNISIELLKIIREIEPCELKDIKRRIVAGEHTIRCRLKALEELGFIVVRQWYGKNKYRMTEKGLKFLEEMG